MRVTVADLRIRARTIRRELDAVRAKSPPDRGEWYPYDIFGNIKRMWRMLGPCFDVGAISAGGVYDIGAADGDMSFLLESFGLDVVAIDNPRTNCNEMTGIERIRQERKSLIRTYEFDIDSVLPLPAGDRSLAIFLGILYHLKNPLGALECVRESAKHCLLSTRIAQSTSDGKVQLEGYPVGYLVAPDELNNDPTNYWIFSFEGAVRLACRAGWRVDKTFRRGGGRKSDPTRNDERLYMMLSRR